MHGRPGGWGRGDGDARAGALVGCGLVGSAPFGRLIAGSPRGNRKGRSPTLGFGVPSTRVYGSATSALGFAFVPNPSPHPLVQAQELNELRERIAARSPEPPPAERRLRARPRSSSS